MTAFELDQVRLLVDDVASCRDFYRDLLEIPVVLETPVYVQLQSGRVSLGIYRRGEMLGDLGGDTLESGPGDRAIVVFRVEDVDAAAERLSARGIEPVAPPSDRPVWGLRTVHFRDPAGNLIELIAALSSS